MEYLLIFMLNTGKSELGDSYAEHSDCKEAAIGVAHKPDVISATCIPHLVSKDDEASG